MPRMPSIASTSSPPTASIAPLWRDKWRGNAAYRERHALTRIGRIYGLSEEQYRRLLAEQKGVCAICRRPPRRRRALCVDHCPVTKQVRRLLCDNCNTPLGLFGDDPGRLRTAADYLERARESYRPGQATPSAHAPRLGLMLDT
jgi:hypothetical protein